MLALFLLYFYYQVDKHNSQKDYKDGFGGKFGVLQDRQDKVIINNIYQRPDTHVL